MVLVAVVAKVVGPVSSRDPFLVSGSMKSRSTTLRSTPTARGPPISQALSTQGLGKGRLGKHRVSHQTLWSWLTKLRSRARTWTSV